MVIHRLIAPHIDFSALRRELDLPTEFPLAAQHEAQRIAAAGAPAAATGRSEMPRVTIGPPGSMDLDQAMCLERRNGGYRVHYAIADVSAFVRPDSAIAAEAWRRGQTVYLPDGRVPLHPTELSEGVASLLPDQVRLAVLWTVDLDATGATIAVRVERATVRSRARLDYPGVQADTRAGTAHPSIALLPELGKLLMELGLARGAINLPIPAQEVERVDGGWELVLRAPLPVEEYNAQISLLTGVAAAKIMLDGKVGLLRTMPRPAAEAVAALRTAAGPLDIPWPEGTGAGRVIASVDGNDPRGAAFLDHAAELFRGAGYTAFDGSVPEPREHGGVAAPYAHVTAPLRRLADRYATEVCLALTADRPVPAWAREALPRLPEVMAATDHLASAADHGAVDLAEAVLLSGRVGECFEAAVLDVDEPRPHHNQDPNHNQGSNHGQGGAAPRPPRGTVAIDKPAVRARCEGPGLIPGQRVPVRLAVADPAARRVLFETVTGQVEG